MDTELNELATALHELADSMSSMRVQRTTSKTQKKAPATTTARRAARRKADEGIRVHQVPVVAMETARMLADGDMSRIKIQPDGSVIVRNK